MEFQFEVGGQIEPRCSYNIPLAVHAAAHAHTKTHNHCRQVQKHTQMHGACRQRQFDLDLHSVRQGRRRHTRPRANNEKSTHSQFKQNNASCFSMCFGFLISTLSVCAEDSNNTIQSLCFYANLFFHYGRHIKFLPIQNRKARQL